MKPLSNQQRLHQVNSEYLFRDRDRHGNGKSLGSRSEKTEGLLAAFTAGRETAQERLRLITEKIDEQARLNKALRLNSGDGDLLYDARKKLDENGLRAANARGT